VGERARPVLAELDLPGTVFVPTDWPGRIMHWPGIDQWRGTRFEPELTALSWSELRDLAGAGWEVGAHSCSHPRLTRLQDDAALRHELEQSRATCERELRRPCRSAAYPFGDANARVREAAEAAGYELVAGLGLRAFTQRTRFEWPRVGVWHTDADWRFRLKVSPLTLHLRGTRWVAALDAARRERRRRGLAR
jgi:peptidoglycan/xylan/chitin deacetylase (PgdA/CDA1 family)